MSDATDGGWQLAMAKKEKKNGNAGQEEELEIERQKRWPKCHQPA